MLGCQNQNYILDIECEPQVNFKWLQWVRTRLQHLVPSLKIQTRQFPRVWWVQMPYCLLPQACLQFVMSLHKNGPWLVIINGFHPWAWCCQEMSIQFEFVSPQFLTTWVFVLVLAFAPPPSPPHNVDYTFNSSSISTTFCAHSS